MRISETAVTAQDLINMTEFARNTAPTLGLKPSVLAIEANIIWVDSMVYDWQQGAAPAIDTDDMVAVLGTVWAEQIIQQHDWVWVNLVFHDYDDWEAYAIVSPDRSLMILPYAFIHECISEGTEVTIAASLTAIGSAVIPTFEPYSYTNLMHGLQRIVPR